MAIILLVYSSLLIEARKVKLQIKRHQRQRRRLTTSGEWPRAQRRWPMRGIVPGRVREAAQQPADRAAWVGKRYSSSSTAAAAAARGVGEKQPSKKKAGLSSGYGALPTGFMGK